MSKPIYVAHGDAGIHLNSGARMVVARPPMQGDTAWYAMTSTNKVVRMRDKRLAGVGVETFLKTHGFSVAPEGDPRAAALQSGIDQLDAVKLVEETATAYRDALRAQAPQKVWVIPFNPTGELKEGVTVVDTAVTTILGLGVGICSPTLRVKFSDSPFNSDIDVLANWIIPVQDGVAPRLFSYASPHGGPLEHATLAMAAIGMGRLVGAKHLEDGRDENVFSRMRGSLTLQTSPDTQLIVGIDAVDELSVELIRNGELVASKSGWDTPPGLLDLSLGSAIGNIACVLVEDRRRQEQAQRPAKKSGRRETPKAA